MTDSTPTHGWQQPPAHRTRPQRCPHLGVVVASLTVWTHDEGHEWICACGAVFVVVSSGGKDKRLVLDWRGDQRSGLIRKDESA
jgi:hypothetical protein